MKYNALLFCPDEKTARVVTQVLNDLEFRVEPCNEPFAAVKRLMAEHFDAIVVDCDSEQNAALLFKSAHNSGSNQSSLAVAVVEGQAGVAKAFRIGANLVLTKPINVEQSKGTLRVARGLLRKTDAAKPTTCGVLLPNHPHVPLPRSMPSACLLRRFPSQDPRLHLCPRSRHRLQFRPSALPCLRLKPTLVPNLSQPKLLCSSRWQIRQPPLQLPENTRGSRSANPQPSQ